ncbi:unnamed protein product [Phytophthora fragariaefolia]|uniref:Unnamed protein product n=1 Tax=Phytophthora fragariaefolia TaxID=1490495 RepID=A0A9W6X7R9_9STRA|nr:unnamed protein product [Phytophthora fragariaefolia]
MSAVELSHSCEAGHPRANLDICVPEQPGIVGGDLVVHDEGVCPLEPESCRLLRLRWSSERVFSGTFHQGRGHAPFHSTMGLTTTNNSVEYLHHVLAHIQKLTAQAWEEGNVSKHGQIRVMHWVRKLRSQPTSNPTWLKSVLDYANVLLQMLLEGVGVEVFLAIAYLCKSTHSITAQSTLSSQGYGFYQIAKLATTARQFARTSIAQKQHATVHPTRAHIHTTRNNNSAESQQATVVPQKISKQIQTQEQDDQWEWQRVWKGAFDKMHLQLQQKTEETKKLAIENKELRSVIAGYKKALEEAERAQRDIEAKHLAEIENLRAVHSLELSNLQARHRQKLQEAALQNDEKLFSRRRESLFTGSSSTVRSCSSKFKPHQWNPDRYFLST